MSRTHTIRVPVVAGIALLVVLTVCGAAPSAGEDTGQSAGQSQRNAQELEKAIEEVAKDQKKEQGKDQSRRQKKYEKEREEGEPVNRQVIAQFGIYRNSELQKYVEQVGKRVAAASSRPDMDFTFTVLDDDMVNAMSLPGGYIYVTRGILAHLNSEAELAAVLGHEIAHVTQRHAARRENRAKLLDVATVATAIATGVYTGVPEVGGILGGVLLQGYSREFELEADRVGAEFMAKAGYSPEAMVRTINVLKASDKLEYEQARAENREPMVYHGILADHPDNDTRYEQTIREAARLEKEYPAFADEGQFLEKLEGMTWGNTHHPGVVRKNVFYDPRLGIKMTFPLGWSLKGSGAGAVIVSPMHDAALEIVSRPLRQDLTPEQFMTDALSLRMREGRAFSVADMPGYIGVADRGQSPFGLKPLRIAALYDDRRQQVYILSGSGKNDLMKIAADKEFIGTIFSLSKMTSSDYRDAKTPRIELVRAEPGTTMESLGKDSPISTYATQNLRVINGLYPDGEPKPGQLVKVVE